MKEIKKLGEMAYPFLLGIIDKYQANYKGPDKMSREYMLKEIERFKPAELQKNIFDGELF